MATIGGTPQFTGQVQGFAVGSLSFASTQGAAQGVAPPQLSAADLQRIIAGAFVALQQLGNTWGGVAGGQTFQPFGSIQPGITVPGGNIAAQTFEPFGSIQPGITVPGGNIAAETFQPFGSIHPGITVPGGTPGAQTFQPFGSIQPGITVPGGIPGAQTFESFGGIQPNFGFPGIGAQSYDSFGQPPMAFPGSFVSPFQQQNIDPFAGAYSAQNPFATPTNTMDAVMQYALANMDPTQTSQFLSIQTPMDAPPIVPQQQVQQPRENHENHEAHENHGQHRGHHKHHHHHHHGQPPVAGTPPQAPAPQAPSPYSSGFPSPYGGPRRF